MEADEKQAEKEEVRPMTLRRLLLNFWMLCRRGLVRMRSSMHTVSPSAILSIDWGPLGGYRLQVSVICVQAQGLEPQSEHFYLR